MSVAGLEAIQLYHSLTAGGLNDLPHRYFDRIADLVDIAWTMALGGDFAYSETEGPKPRGTNLFNRYLARLIRKAHTDEQLVDAFYRVLMMEKSPTSLMRPRILWQVLKPTK